MISDMRWQFRPKPRWSSRAVGLLLHICGLCILYTVYERITNGAPRHVHIALAHTVAFWKLEREAHIAIELSINSWLSKSITRMELANLYYDFMHFLVPAA